MRVNLSLGVLLIPVLLGAACGRTPPAHVGPSDGSANGALTIQEVPSLAPGQSAGATAPVLGPTPKSQADGGRAAGQTMRGSTQIATGTGSMPGGPLPVPGAPGQDITNPCQVVTKTEVAAVEPSAAAVGDPQGPLDGKAIGVDGMKECQFQAPTAGTKPGVTVVIGLTTQGGRQAFDKYKYSLPGKLTPVPDLGDDAVWYPQYPNPEKYPNYPELGWGRLVVLKGDKVLGVFWLEHDTRDFLGLSKTIAGLGLKRL